jgi:3-(3-hydroxy-phenyl)propionate hydroxylase
MDGMVAQGLKVHDYQHRDRRTNNVAKFQMDLLEGETRHPYRLQCEQYKMTGLAVEALEKFPHAEVRFGTRVKGYSETDGGVKVLVESKAEGEELIDGSYLVGTDGSNSVVRQSSGVLFKGLTYPELFLVASTSYRFENYFEDLSLVNYVSDPDEWCVLLATVDFWRVLIPTPVDGSDELFLSDEFIQDRLHRLADNDGDFEILHRTLYRVHQRVAETYRARDRVLLAGDAAHINNPLGGMGMNGGIHDAINLAEKLVEVIKNGKDRHDMLDLYDRQRRGICEKFILKHTSQNKKLMEAKEEGIQKSRQEKLMLACSDDTIGKNYVMESSMIDCLRESYAIQ